jgi:hypothetical protein
MDAAGGELSDPLLTNVLHGNASGLRHLCDLCVARCIEDLEDFAASASQSLDHGSDAVDGLRHRLPAGEDRAFRGVLDRPALGSELGAQTVGDRPVLPAPSKFPCGDPA